MEIVYALVLLFGGFALGSVTAVHDPSVQSPPSVAKVQSQEAMDLTSIDSLTCGGKSAVIYRDLTASYPNQPERLESPADACAEGCPDE